MLYPLCAWGIQRLQSKGQIRPTHFLFLKIKCYWNTAMLNVLSVTAVFSHHSALRAEYCNRGPLAQEASVFTILFYTGKVCWPWYIPFSSVSITPILHCCLSSPHTAGQCFINLISNNCLIFYCMLGLCGLLFLLFIQTFICFPPNFFTLVVINASVGIYGCKLYIFNDVFNGA